ncbi:MotA/TolQ/ExbB proton channel family protein [Vibrio hannami]|uniref:MotA/TolQ/ExbB proton channel family protein n=1 Tax=Vibrio hannami TaxID=2717094 RepID=UPI00240FBA4E|nr:MotA/TolQ/ExbB proton channel family protein [Vibrio hannami]MDG3084904.1 MotA/TolQ/ExbB proton channel family protein [Vibrio hannami]
MKQVKFILGSVLLTILFVLSAPASAGPELLSSTKQVQTEERIKNEQREEQFHTKEEELRQIRDRLLAEKQSLEASIDNLSHNFSENEQLLADKEKALHLESGSLGELFGVVHQVAKELQSELNGSVTAIGQDKSIEQLNEIVRAKVLPSKEELYALWETLNAQLKVASGIEDITVPVVHSDGVIGDEHVLRLGAFGIANESGYLKWSGDNLGAVTYKVQPINTPLKTSLTDQNSLVSIDPSKGQLLEQLALTPTLSERVEQGGVVGIIILGLLATGLLIGLVQGAFLLNSRIKINAQLKDTGNIGNNALGRVLSVYKYDESPNVEALELRLFEAVLDELQTLERGLSMIKLIAALSPMLGLLGTVTGMIETFQVITQYGNADPRVMAGGISTALITTVLGLVAAMPLLFIHNILSSQAESIRTILEKQGVGLVAQRAELTAAEQN